MPLHVPWHERTEARRCGSVGNPTRGTEPRHGTDPRYAWKRHSRACGPATEVLRYTLLARHIDREGGLGLDLVLRREDGQQVVTATRQVEKRLLDRARQHLDVDVVPVGQVLQLPVGSATLDPHSERADKLLKLGDLLGELASRRHRRCVSCHVLPAPWRDICPTGKGT